MTNMADMFRMRRSTSARSTTKVQRPTDLVEPDPADADSSGTGNAAQLVVEDADPLLAEPLRVLVVCTANISRSPLGEVLFAHHLRHAGVDARVTSAGTLATHLAVDHHSVTVAAELGLDLTAHLPRLLSRAIIARDGADLIVTMERAHAREVCLIEPDAWPRTFTVKELARLAERSSVRSDGPRSWLNALGADRTVVDLLGEDPSDDIPDTYGTSVTVHRKTAEELDELIGQIIRRAARR